MAGFLSPPFLSSGFSVGACAGSFEGGASGAAVGGSAVSARRGGSDMAEAASKDGGRKPEGENKSGTPDYAPARRLSVCALSFETSCFTEASGYTASRRASETFDERKKRTTQVS